MEGLSPQDLDLAAQTVVSKGYESATVEDGPWVITLDEPNYHSFMGISQTRDLREEIYRAYATWASSRDIDNTLIIDEILKLRLEKAKLLGYDNYVEAACFKTGRTLHRYLQKEIESDYSDDEDPERFDENQGAEQCDDSSHCDINLGSEMLLEAEDDIDEDDTHEYFLLPEAMEGLFNLARTLFGIEIEAADGLAPVKVVFHEVGYALQHMLTEQDKGLVSGFRGIEDDAGELPSLFVENWCYHR
ncbi:hypothetical protein NL676_012443 [Syzygium grande]|nr:hypothetical protein NL676_012443 [Syzygium grande]